MFSVFPFPLKCINRFVKGREDVPFPYPEIFSEMTHALAKQNLYWLRQCAPEISKFYSLEPDTLESKIQYKGHFDRNCCNIVPQLHVQRALQMMRVHKKIK